MCRIVGRLTGVCNWRDTEYVRDYQEKYLGRRDGNTFLTEVLPLPKRSTGSWPYDALWPTKDEYERSVLGDRIDMLRELRRHHTPRYTFCYGKGFWDHHKHIFKERRFRPLIENDAEISVENASVVVLTRFFEPTYQGFTIDFIGELCTAVISDMEGM